MGIMYTTLGIDTPDLAPESVTLPKIAAGSVVFLANAVNTIGWGSYSKWHPDIVGVYAEEYYEDQKCWIPLNFLKVGDEIVSYRLMGDADVTLNVIKLDCKLVKITKGDPVTTSDPAGGAIVRVTGDGVFDVEAVLSAVEVVAADKTYLLELEGSTIEWGNTIWVMGAEVTLNRK